MARETKAQREARLELEAAQRLEVAKATYVERMMAVLRRATKQNFELEVSDSMRFLVTDRDGREDYFYVVLRGTNQPIWRLLSLSNLWSGKKKRQQKQNAVLTSVQMHWLS
jgi:hypothetical protein